MNLEQCLDVYFAGEEEEFAAFASEVLNDEAKQEQFSALIAELPVPKRGEFWRGLLASVRSHHRDHLDATYCLAILAVSTWMDLFPAAAGEEPPPQSLLDLLTELHDSLFELHDEVQLQEDVASLCERWYLEDRPLREHYLPQLIPTLVMASFDGNANRVFALRHALLRFDFANGDNDMLKSLLLKCFLSPVYLKSPKGKRVLSFIMSLSRDMMLACHFEMQQFQTKSLEPFAQVYFDTWMYLLKRREEQEEEEGEEEDVLEAFENELVQNELVHGALYHADVAKRKACLKMLDLAFHDNKREKRVDSLLCRIYAPLVFTGLNATNADVRRNAATLLFNAFPLHDPYSGVQEIATLLDQQFLAIESLLFDPNPECRACAADGVCRLLALFWETIPKSRCSKFLQILINDLAFDKSAPVVRQAVFAGLGYMLDFPLCHPVLRNSIRFLHDHFHDRALAVRTEFAKLLVKLDSTVGFAFTEFVQLEDVLHRLVLDSNRRSLKLLLCGLLVPVFFPKDADNVEQLKRARLLASTNPEASTIFFSTLSLVCKRDEWNRIVKLVLLFGSFVNARRKEIEQASEEEEEEDASDVESAIQCICALWGPIAGEIASNALYESSRERLGEMFDAERFLLPLWDLKRFELVHLCKLVGPGCQAIEKKILKRLYVAGETKGVDLEVDLVCSWNGSCVQRVLKECVRSLNLCLREANGESVSKKRLGEARAVRILSRIVFHHECTAAWELMEQEEGLREFWELLDLARSMPRNRAANALVLLEIKIGMQREDDSALRWMLAKMASEEEAVSVEVQRGVFMLAADCTALGFSLVDLGLQLLLRQATLDAVQASGMDRFVLRLLQFHPDHAELCDAACELVAEPGKTTDEFLLQWFRINPKQVFRRIVLGNGGEVATHLVHTKATQVFGQALLALEQDPHAMLEFVRGFVQREGWDDKTTRGFARELVQFSDRVGGLLGDQAHNLASELTMTTV